MKIRSYLINRRQARRQPEISLTPLIDTALTLLIIFMVTTPMLKKENALEIELPKGNVNEVNENLPQELVVHVDKQRKISFNGKIVSQDILVATLRKAVSENAKKTVFVKADNAVDFGFVIALIDAIKGIGGIRYVALATEKVRASS